MNQCVIKVGDRNPLARYLKKRIARKVKTDAVLRLFPELEMSMIMAFDDFNLPVPKEVYLAKEDQPILDGLFCRLTFEPAPNLH